MEWRAGTEGELAANEHSVRQALARADVQGVSSTLVAEVARRMRGDASLRGGQRLVAAYRELEQGRNGRP